MAQEKGTVTRVNSNIAWVKTIQSSACKSCASKSFCGSHGGGQEKEVEVLNDAGAKTGDKVVLSFETSSLLKVTFLLYVFPILSMFAGAILGIKFAAFFSFSETTSSAIFGFLFFFLSVFFVKIKGNKLAKKNAYRPRITRILRQDYPLS